MLSNKLNTIDSGNLIGVKQYPNRIFIKPINLGYIVKEYPGSDNNINTLVYYIDSLFHETNNVTKDALVNLLGGEIVCNNVWCNVGFLLKANIKDIKKVNFIGYAIPTELEGNTEKLLEYVESHPDISYSNKIILDIVPDNIFGIFYIEKETITEDDKLEQYMIFIRLFMLHNICAKYHNKELPIYTLKCLDINKDSEYKKKQCKWICNQITINNAVEEFTNIMNTFPISEKNYNIEKSWKSDYKLRHHLYTDKEINDKFMKMLIQAILVYTPPNLDNIEDGVNYINPVKIKEKIYDVYSKIDKNSLIELYEIYSTCSKYKYIPTGYPKTYKGYITSLIKSLELNNDLPYVSDFIFSLIDPRVYNREIYLVNKKYEKEYYSTLK